MPGRHPSSGPSPLRTLNPAVQKILEGLDLLDSAPHCDTRARMLAVLGDRYRGVFMFGRCIQMYERSLRALNTEDVCNKLAEFYVHLLGEAGFESARTLVEELSSAFVIEKWITRKQAAITRHKQRKELDQQYPALKPIIGESQLILEVCQQIIRHAPSQLPILISGPTGSGKELVARALHRLSGRTSKPLVIINCSEGPETLFESRLFGHKKGAFTGAVSDQTGFIEAANGGTLCLDELGELPMSLQPKLLRVLETGEFYRVGDVKPRKANVRFIAATNRDLPTMAKEGRFRQDLYSRLKGEEITLKPLEDRLEDLPLLVRHFIHKHGSQPEHATFSPYDILNWVVAHYMAPLLLKRASTWSVRDLEHAVRRALTNRELQHRGHYPIIDCLADRVNNEWKEGIGPTCYTRQQLTDFDTRIALELCPRPREKDAAKLLGISPGTLSRRKACLTRKPM